MKILRAFTTIAVVLAPACVVAAAPQNDLRDFRIGMPVSAFPNNGYVGLACADDQSKTLTGWDTYETCPAAQDGTRAVSFRYDSGETQVAGQPVRLALLIGNDSKLAGIKIDTDPDARLYAHKKAFLFALQVRARFGEDGWNCRQQQPTQSEQPVGGVFINEHCEKSTETRRLVLDRELFRDPAKDLRDFTNATQLTILRP